MPGKLLEAEHHTLADWDFEKGDENRSLSDDFFISAPTSLKFTAPSTFGNIVLCRIPATMCLPQGELRTWQRKSSGNFYPALFRSQAPLGTADALNMYMIYSERVVSRLFRVIAGAPVQVDTTTLFTYLDQWCHHRVYWYNGVTPGEEPALCVDLYRQEDGEWIKDGATMYDTANQWADSEINRCGFREYLPAGHISYTDDTEIWGPV